MYRVFSDTKNISKMLRQIIVFIEEETLQNSITLKNDPFICIKEKYYKWVKYVSAKSQNNRDVYIYWDQKYEDIFVENLNNKILNEKKYIQKLNRYFVKSYKDFERTTDRFYDKGKDFYKKRSIGQLLLLFDKFSCVNQRILSAYYIPYYSVIGLGKIIENQIEKTAISGRTGRRPEKIFRILTTVGVKTFVGVERIYFLEKLKKIQKIFRKGKNWHNNKIQSLIFKHWYDFGTLMFTHHTGSNYSLADYHKKFFSGLRIKVKSELKKIKHEELEEKNRVNDVLKSFNKYPGIKRYIIWLRKMLNYRNCEAEYYNVYFNHCKDFFSEISRRLKMEDEDFYFLSKKEIIGGLRGKLDARKIVVERKEKGFTIKGSDKKIKVLTGVRKDDWYEEDLKEKNISSFRGMAAYKGSATGYAKIVLNAGNEGEKFSKGEVLVTAMTKPDFVPLMKKATAIITDEGGITCHAAIVAREMKKPCIIGTKIATKVLKDGDLVEVDADNGIIKIFKKGK